MPESCSAAASSTIPQLMIVACSFAYALMHVVPWNDSIGAHKMQVLLSTTESSSGIAHVLGEYLPPLVHQPRYQDQQIVNKWTFAHGKMFG